MSGESHGQRSLAGYSPWGHKELDMTEHKYTDDKLVFGIQSGVFHLHPLKRVALGGTSGKESPASAGDLRDLGSIPGSGRSSAGGHGNPLQYFGLENPMDRGAWWATAHRVAKSQTQLK